jgi:C-terminal processing protease CtpA/Prc
MAVQGSNVPRPVKTFDEAGFPAYVLSEVKAQNSSRSIESLGLDLRQNVGGETSLVESLDGAGHVATPCPSSKSRSTRSTLMFLSARRKRSRPSARKRRWLFI